MRKTIAIFIIIAIALTFLFGCGGGSRMRQTKNRTRGGLPKLVDQIDKDAQGAPVITITEEMTYPGMTPYEDAKYDFVAGDTPQKVAKWFENSLKDCVVNRRTGAKSEDTKWEITYKDYQIDIVTGPHGNDTLIRYKKIIKRGKK